MSHSQFHNTLSLAGTAGPARSAGVPRCPSAPEEQKFGFKEFTPIGANERPVTATPPAHRRHTCDHPIAPTGTPQDPVRTQGCSRRDHPKGRRQACGIRPSGGGPDPADTPTNGGYRRAAPPGICFSMMASGQRSTDPNGAGDQTATGLRSPQTAPPRRFTPRRARRAGTFGDEAQRDDLPGREVYHRHRLVGESLGKRSRVRSRFWGDRFCMGWSVHSVDFPYKVGHPLSPTWPQIWEVRHSAKGAWPTGDPTDPRFSPAPRRAVTPVSPGATANWPTGRSVEHRKRRPTVSPSAKANGRLAGVYLRDLAPDARRRNPQVPAPNAGPPPRGSANPSTFAPNWYPCRLALRPCSTADPLGGRDAVQTFPCPESILGGTVLPYKVGQSRVPPIADNWWAAAVAGRASRPRSPCSPKSDRRLVAPEEPRAVAHRRPCRVGNWRPHRASTAQSGHRDPLRVAHASKATGDPPGPVERAVAHPVAVAMSDGPTGVSCPRSPSKRPALPDPLVGGVVHKSSQGRADAQRLVATRLLDRLHDPLGHFSPSSPGLLPGSRRQPAEVRGPEAYSYPTTTCGATSPRSGTDSDLEAFSHYPADGSVAALPGQTAAKTNYLNQRFLSY
ncbi:hypothetical protein OAory_01022750 [Aspergillus oryzae]|uniref:Uncharacterized protein n=1 Tax=Aspergillus oryzae TaxID=5062 RepID=A0A1S9D4T7_ASPOZ|nr:hypothetical protein OAory_01022750 [Aspergillus oryzae]